MVASMSKKQQEGYKTDSKKYSRQVKGIKACSACGAKFLDLTDICPHCGTLLKDSINDT